jgi:ATP-dependent Clp protease ATP-binding subunit ClpC
MGAIMFERFTDRARKIMALANRQAIELNHSHIDTAHILLGMLEEGSGVGVRALRQMEIDTELLLRDLSSRLERGPTPVPSPSKLPQTPPAKQVIMDAIAEANDLSHRYVGTEHILLGLLRQPDELASQSLNRAGAELHACREEVRRLHHD